MDGNIVKWKSGGLYVDAYSGYSARRKLIKPLTCLMIHVKDVWEIRDAKSGKTLTDIKGLQMLPKRQWYVTHDFQTLWSVFC